MIMNMKKYENPMLQVVSINKNDIIATSEQIPVGVSGSANNAEAPGMRVFDWDAGY